MSHAGRWVVRKAWDLQRFGLTPPKLWARLTNRSEPRILLISIPKAGTHLVERALCLHPRLYRKFIPTLHSKNLERYGGLENLLRTLKPGQALISHLHYSPEQLKLIEQYDVRCIFVIRDPRDIVVSRAHYVARNREHPYHFLFEGRSLKERIRLAIVGDPETGYVGIRERLERFAGWIDTSAFVVRFEQLARAESRPDALRSLYDYLGIELDRDRLSLIGKSLVSSASPTFRKGTVGGWKQAFDEEIRRLFEQAVDEALMKWYGYGDEMGQKQFA